MYPSSVWPGLTVKDLETVAWYVIDSHVPTLDDRSICAGTALKKKPKDFG